MKPPNFKIQSYDIINIDLDKRFVPEKSCTNCWYFDNKKNICQKNNYPLLGFLPTISICDSYKHINDFKICKFCGEKYVGEDHCKINNEYCILCGKIDCICNIQNKDFFKKPGQKKIWFK